jgi:hypothetical protein
MSRYCHIPPANGTGSGMLKQSDDAVTEAMQLICMMLLLTQLKESVTVFLISVLCVRNAFPVLFWKINCELEINAHLTF